MPRKLSVFALMNMEGQKVLVHDLEYDALTKFVKSRWKKRW